MKTLVRLILLATALFTSGCSFFGIEKSAVDVAELVPLAGMQTARVVWNSKLGKGADGKGVKLVASLDGSTLYVAHFDGKVEAVSTSSGASLWKTDLGIQISGGPGVGNGLVISGTTEGEVIALSQSTGSESWRATVSTDIPAVPVSARGIVVIHTNDGKLYGLDAATGGQLWLFHRATPVLSLRGAGTPVIEGNSLYSGLDGGKLVKLDLMSGRPSWETPITYASGRTELDRVVDIDGLLVLGPSLLYVVTYQGDMAAVNKSDGKVKWRTAYSSWQGVISDGRALYASDANGYVAAVNPHNGEILWRQKALSGRRLSPPVMAGNLIAVADLEGYVHWLSPEDGSIVARIEAVSSGVRAPLVAQGSVVYVYADKGELAAVTAQ
ncbi:MAG: outer membrane protein assembly factor BamB [Gammaproteobacteria bacterium]|nr:outer membrane protein assembly factor BamB [Gammaproteobacteria bacterium]